MKVLLQDLKVCISNKFMSIILETLYIHIAEVGYCDYLSVLTAFLYYTE